MGTSLMEILFTAVLGYGLYKTLGPFQAWLERKLSDFTRRAGYPRGTVIDVEPEDKKKKGS